ncbi:GrdX protein [Pseudoflavonifractor sp. 524-17]|nr:GrdX family protein [Pseudoflavonifractor sp. 524-17]NCE64839.1 GrdX protein [Pseudoflavonifractor sp. 524-17]
MILVTNNEKVRQAYGGLCTLQFVEGGHTDVLCAVRDLIHQGHKLLTHPLAGSVKPNETPFRSVALTRETGGLDMDSLTLIESALAVCRQFKPRFQRGEDAPESMREDFAEIDYRLIHGALAPHLQKGE